MGVRVVGLGVWGFGLWLRGFGVRGFWGPRGLLGILELFVELWFRVLGFRAGLRDLGFRV